MKGAFFFCCLVLSHPLCAGWIDRKAEGWAWYEDRETPEQSCEKDQEPVADTKQISAKEVLEKRRMEVEEKLAQAILEPTLENVSSYMEEQQKIVHQSAVFSSVWAKALLANPHLDQTREFPISQYGIQLRKKIDRENLENLIRGLSATYGLFFFYEGNNPESHAFSRVVLDFSRKYGMEVIAISSDGTLIDGFADNHADNGIISRLSVSAFPSLFLVNPNQAEILPIAFGLVSIDRIEHNVELHFQGLSP